MVEIRTGDMTNKQSEELDRDFQLCSCSNRYSTKEHHAAQSLLRRQQHSALPQPLLLTLAEGVIKCVAEEAFALRPRKEEEIEDNCVMRNFTIFTLHRMSFR